MRQLAEFVPPGFMSIRTLLSESITKQPTPPVLKNVGA